MSHYPRRLSNELAVSVRLQELRQLQTQLSSVIQDENDVDNAMHSAVSSRSIRSTETDQSHDVESGVGPYSRSTSLSLPITEPEPERPILSSSVKGGRRCATRRLSNDLAASIRLEELRQLQTQLSSVIQDNNVSPSGGLESSNHGIDGSTSTRTDTHISLPSESEPDLESGVLPQTYKPVRCSSNQNFRTVASSQTLSTMASLSCSSDGTKSDDSSSSISGSTSNAAASSDLADAEANPSRGRWISRTISRRSSRSKSNDSRSAGSSNSSRRFSILKQMSSKNESSSFDVEKQSLTGRLPNYEFLAHGDKERSSLKAGHTWWHGVFVLSLVSLIACMITLWASYPIGARMPSSEVAKMPWSNGCIGVNTCICPRETICADDLLSMIFLTIARASAWFDYPLYMLLFLSKANNLNNFLQTTALRCWINFSDYHKVHSLFGSIVAIETTCHSFFHLLRWARRSNDIQLLWTTETGITGLIAFSLTPFIALPMAVPYLKKRMKFEWRKSK